MSQGAAKSKVVGEARTQGPAAMRAPAPAPNSQALANPSLTGVQQGAGNMAIQQMLSPGPVHARLSISQPGDPDEAEANRAAARVMSMRQPVPGGGAQLSGAGARAGAASPSGHPLQILGSGQPLDRETRAFFEPRFGADFSQVRIHTGSHAESAAQAIQARAFTAGQHVVFGRGQFATGSSADKSVLAHELAHTLQAPRGGDHPRLQREPDPNQASGTAPAPLTLEDLVRAQPPGFTDVKLDEAYQKYLHSNSSPAKPAQWAVSVTVGVPRERLVQLLGPDYAKGQRAGLARPPIDVTSPTAPQTYDPARQQQDMAALQAGGASVTQRLDNLTYSSATGLSVSSGHHAILKGNIAETLAQPLIDQVLTELRKQYPGAQLYRPMAELYVEGDTWTQPLMFTDGIIAVIEPAGLRLLRVVETKSGKDGGITAQEQVHRWIENHSTTGMRIVLPGVPRKFELRGSTRQVIGLANAPRLVIVPSDAKVPGERSGHGTAASVTVLRLPQSSAELNYLTEATVQRLLLESQARQVMDMAKDQPMKPAEVKSTLELQESTTITRLQNESKGLAVVNGVLYRVGSDASGRSIQRLPTSALQIPQGQTNAGAYGNTGNMGTNPPLLEPGVVPPTSSVPNAGRNANAAGTPLLSPPPGTNTRTAPIPVPGLPGQAQLAPGVNIPTNVINVSGQPISVQGRVVQPSQPVELREGDIVVRGASGMWTAVHAGTGRPIAAVYEGGRFYTVVAGNSVVTVGPDGRVTTGSGLRLVPLDSQSPGGAGGTGGAGTARSPAMQGVAVGLALIVLANEILGPIGRNLNQQRRNIAVGKAQINFWAQFGGDPKHRVWDIGDQGPLAEKSEADTSWYGSGSYPYVVSINKQGFGATLPTMIKTYKDYLLFLDMAKVLGTIHEDPTMPAFPSAEERKEPRRYYAMVNAPDRDLRVRVDVTDVIAPLGETLLTELDTDMRAKVAALSETERKNIFRLKNGSATTIYRSARGGQPIQSSKQLLGNDPWVRLLGKELEGGVYQWFVRGQYRDRVLVVPANADAKRGAVVSAYEIKKTPDEVLEEVKDGNRPIISREPADGDVTSFVAGPEPGESRFGETRYYRHPNWPDIRHTVAIGELTQFWVDERDLEPVGLPESEAYGKGAAATAK